MSRCIAVTTSCATARNSLRHPAFLTLALSALLSAGCIKVEQTLTLEKDGSGTMAVAYAMQESAITEMESISKEARELEGLAGDEGEDMPFDFNEADIRADFLSYTNFGVQLQDVKIETVDGWRHVHLNVSFQNLPGLLKTELLNDRDITLTRNAEGNYVFRQAAPVQDLETEELAGMDRETLNTMLTQMMKGFRAVMQVRVPSRILSTTATSRTENSATWEFDLEKDPTALERAQKLEMEVVFEGKDLSFPEEAPADRQPDP